MFAAILCYLLVKPPRSTARASVPRGIDTVGLLQWTYLFGSETQAESVVNVESPDIQNLRAAGMEVMWNGLRRR